jgi:tRNA nucleotidyltransferase/poly(A) polymerase
MTTSAPIKQTIDFLSSHNAYVVGGAVRERLLGMPSSDYDLVIASDPANISKSLAGKLGGSSFCLDAEHGISRVALSGQFHIDLAKRQGDSQDADLDRRDFTVNALAVPLNYWLSNQWKKHIVDRHNGLNDLAKKTIRIVSSDTFVDDPLRLLRAYRIAAQLGFSIEPKTRRLIQKNKKLLKRVAPERVREEMLKMFSTPNAYLTVKEMDKDGFLDVVFPEAATLRRCATGYYGKGGVLKHSIDSIGCYEDVIKKLSSWFPRVHKKIREHLRESVSGHPRSAHLKWALLLHDLGKPATAKMRDGRLRFFEHEHAGANDVLKMASRYRWSNMEASRYERLVRNHMRAGNLANHDVLTDKAIHRYFRDLADDGIGMLLVSLGDHLTYVSPKMRGKKRTSHEKVTVQMINRFYTAREKVLPPKLLNGNDVMKTFRLEPSPYIGELLQAITDAQTDGKVKTKDDALAFLKTYVKSKK